MTKGSLDTQRGPSSKLSDEQRALGYEKTDWPVGKVTLSLIGLIAFVLLMAGGVRLLVTSFGGPTTPVPTHAMRQQMKSPGPQPQSSSTRQRVAIERAAHARLAGAGGHMPIAQAMAKTVKSGWSDQP